MTSLSLPPRALSFVLPLLMLLAPCSVARAVNNFWIGPNLGNWNTAANWQHQNDPSFHDVPDASFNEAALINNGATASLNAPAMNAMSNGDVGGVKLGISGIDPIGDPETGGLRIGTNGVLRAVVTSSGVENGAITVGAGTGTGTLTVLGNGSLTGTSLSVAGSANSTIALSDTASLTLTGTPSGGPVTGTANLQRTVTISGPSVNFSASGDLTLGSTSTLIADIRSATSHSALKTNATANVDGTFKPMFTGVTPAVGNKWTLIDAAGTINGTFSAVDTSLAPALPIGQSYHVIQGTSGGRALLQLAVEEVLTLQVNRVTGAVSIANIGSVAKTIDGYSIISPHGSLTGTWNSLDDQNVNGSSGAQWLEAAPTPNDLNELYPQAGGTTINGGNALSLGTQYVKTFPAFGVDPDDMSFEYSQPDGRIVQGDVVYSGAKTHNNFVLNVDPSTGQVAFRND